jgi:hypothetical protein
MSKKTCLFGCVYLLINLTNGRRYVGKDKTGDPESHRWKSHIYAALKGGSRYYLHRAIRKAHRESKGVTLGFSAEVIWRGPIDQLSAMETYYIKKLRSYVLDPLGDASYNLTLGGDGVLGFKRARASRKRQSAKMKLLWEATPEEVREARRLNHVAAMNTLEAFARMSASQVRRFASMTEDEQLAFGKKLSKAQLKRYKKPGALEVMSAAQVRRFADDAKREINAIAHRTPEFRKLQSELSAEKWADLKWREKWLKSNNTPEAAARKSEIARTWYKDPVKKANHLAGTTSPSAQKKRSESLTTWYAAPKNKKKHLRSHRTKEFRDRKASDTTQFFAAMTPEERKAYWHITHPNGNGWGKHKGKSKAARRKAAEAKTETKASKPKKK